VITLFRSVSELFFLFGAENRVDGCSAHGALPAQCWLAVLHRDLLSILQFSLFLAFDAVIQVCHG